MLMFNALKSSITSADRPYLQANKEALEKARSDKMLDIQLKRIARLQSEWAQEQENNGGESE